MTDQRFSHDLQPVTSDRHGGGVSPSQLSADNVRRQHLTADTCMIADAIGMEATLKLISELGGLKLYVQSEAALRRTLLHEHLSQGT